MKKYYISFTHPLDMKMKMKVIHPTNGYNAVLTENYVPDKVKMLPLEGTQEDLNLIWSPESVPFSYQINENDINKYAKSVERVADDHGITCPLELRIIIPTGLMIGNGFPLVTGNL